jgi:hypothetical protein
MRRCVRAASSRSSTAGIDWPRTPPVPTPTDGRRVPASGPRPPRVGPVRLRRRARRSTRPRPSTRRPRKPAAARQPAANARSPTDRPHTRPAARGRLPTTTRSPNRFLTRRSAAGSNSVRPVTSNWQNSTIPRPSRYSSSGVYCKLNPPSTIGRKSPRAGFSIETEATLPRLPHRHNRGTSSPHQRTDGAPLYRELGSRSNRGGTSVASPRQSRRCCSVQSRQQGMVRDAQNHVPQPVLDHAEAQPLLQRLGRLLEHQHLQPLAHSVEVRRRTFGR